MTMIAVDAGAGGGGTDALAVQNSGSRHAFWKTIRRYRGRLIGLFCVVCSALFLAIPMLPRTYELSGTQQVTIRPFAALPELGRVADVTMKEFSGRAGGLPVTIASAIGSEGGKYTVAFSASAANRDTAWVQIHYAADQLAETTRHRAD